MSYCSLPAPEAPQKPPVGQPEEGTKVPGSGRGGDGSIQASKFRIRYHTLFFAQRTVGFLADGMST